MKSFFEKINFVKNFTSGFAEIVRHPNDMLKKNIKIDWILEVKKVFEDIKEVISTAPMLISLDYEVPFKIYSFSLDYSYARVLT